MFSTARRAVTDPAVPYTATAILRISNAVTRRIMIKDGKITASVATSDPDHLKKMIQKFRYH